MRGASQGVVAVPRDDHNESVQPSVARFSPRVACCMQSRIVPCLVCMVIQACVRAGMAGRTSECSAYW